MSTADIEALRDGIRASARHSGDAAAVARDVGFEDVLNEDRAVAAVFFEEFGRLGLDHRLNDAIAANALGCSGPDTPSLGYPLPGIDVPNRRTGGGLGVDVLVRGVDGDSVSSILLLAGEEAVLVPTSGLQCSPAKGFDIVDGWTRWRGSVSADDSDVLSTDGARHVRAVVRAALASELNGIASKVNELAVDHVTSRHQFGQALGSFQSVRHRLAETHVAIHAAMPVIELAWQATACGDAGSAELATAAKALAGRAFEIAAKNAHQVCGGMGLSWEHPLHRWVRRGTVLNSLIGSPDELAADLGGMLARGAALPVPNALCDDENQSTPA
ncbi:acyl-CoA dehydrogenase family protein [Mycobacterium sp. UM_CSW]|uniref:acyl-CoA dehydrogenase family protein n=1 Tax=Mycobacterium sp. UM_CSW TaxID=1370119 RepID=UPI0013782189|nr:acyl-CoA dehydrogenase family protein [Mycobacterium sp. UM_CSW]